ncbi:hypothetical protein PG985_009653 [Apiospora marii]|uniref:uncharacterized protein n=1 Tax=Apiospora marii TaxID=335849 RepID=UPI00312D7832
MAPLLNGVYRAPESRKSNTQLVEDLKSAPGVDESKLKNRVAFAIHEDANDVPTREPASLDPGKNDWEVHGGRLGRDHTLEDVPNHYLRDRLMSFTNRCMPKDQSPEARRRVFSDLNEGEIAAYSRIIRKDEATLGHGYQLGSGSEWRERCARHEKQQKRLQKMDSITKIAHETEFLSNMGQAAELEEQHRFMDHIDPDIDMTPHPIGQHRNYDDLPPIWASVFHFGHRNREPSKPSPRERKALPAPFYSEINYDCDQVRALVKRFIRADLPRIWDLEKFRLVCGLQRPELNEFLEQSGPEAGAQSPAYGLCWEFMRRRQTLGLHPFFDEKKADRIFPLHLAKRRPAKGGRPKQSTRQQQAKRKREVEKARKHHRPTDAELRERRRAEAESKEKEQRQQEQHKQEEQQKQEGPHKQHEQHQKKKKRELPVERPARASKRIKAQKAGG